jgi:SPP1 gp7 family putative phage head morphogenesis protein
MKQGDDGDLRETAFANLETWKQSGAVKTLRFYSAEDGGVCCDCRQRHGLIVSIDDAAVGLNLPPLDACCNERRRCYFRPWDVSVQ